MEDQTVLDASVAKRQIVEHMNINRIYALRIQIPNSMSTDTNNTNNRESFMELYNEHRNDAFDFNAELLKYYRSDVDILRRCCLKFRDIFIDLTSDGRYDGMDPFSECITINSACNLVFRRTFLQPDAIEIIQAHGYIPEEKHSVKASKWIRYMSHTENIHIQHAPNGGEKTISQYRVDGYHERENGFVCLFVVV